MTRRVGETIEVRTGSEEPAEDEGGAPQLFLWRGRLYQVLSVVDRWQERSAWWRATADGVPLDRAGAPRQVWRVTARPGRAGAEGIYDLRLDPCASPSPWSLLRTQD